MTTEEKLCTRCKETKPLLEFGLKRGKPYSWCKVCNREHVRKWNRENPDKVLEMRSNGKLKKYGITPQQYWEMLARQGDGCAACGLASPSEFIGKRKRFDVDHDHDTGKIRGLLCQACNLALGILREDPERFRKLAEYLERYK